MDAIKPFSFVSSPYPVILSIENHCSPPQQDRMAEHMVSILGDMLYCEPVDKTQENLPSPEQLKNKILLKAKKIKKEEEEVCNDTEVMPKPPRRAKKISTTNLPEKKAEAETKESVKTQSEALSSLVNYCEALKFSSFEQERSFWQMSSFEETKALDIFNNETNSKKFLSYNCRNLSRVYPKGTRLFSSNMSRMQCFQKKIKQIFLRSVSILDNGMPNGSSQLSGGKTSFGEVAHLSSMYSFIYFTILGR